MKKKLLLVSCLLGLAFGLVACGNNAADDKPSSEETAVTTETAETTPSPEVVDTEASNNDTTENVENPDSTGSRTEEEENLLRSYDSSMQMTEDDFLNVCRIVQYYLGENNDTDAFQVMAKLIVNCVNKSGYSSVEEFMNSNTDFSGISEAANIHTGFNEFLRRNIAEGILSSSIPDDVLYFTIVDGVSNEVEARDSVQDIVDGGKLIYMMSKLNDSQYMVFFTE